MSKERWKDVVGYEGLYLVSDQGRIKSLARISIRDHKLKEKILKPYHSGKYDHLQVKLYKNEQIQHCFVHRLVLEMFVGPCPKGLEACHNNQPPTNNRLENLRWDTRSNNQLDSIRHGTRFQPDSCGIKNGRSKLTEHQVVEIRLMLKSKTYLHKEIAELFSISKSTVSDINVRKSWRHIDV